ncbi:hypothetical protein [Streptomyces sp. NPDC057854]|uniref:hypothetical protein n=1 Tax=unclassified Streptomyces TaxID=2593676 RepID=UPI00369F94EC
MELRRPPAVLAVLALVPLLVAGCSDGSPPPEPADVVETVDEEPAGEKTGDTGTADEAARQRARDAVGSPDDPEFVEGGSAPAAEGAHIRAVLDPGAAYDLSVACVGTGSVRVVVAGRAPATLPCDGAPLHRRVADAPAELPVDVTPAGGTKGVVAWQIDTVDPDGNGAGAPEAAEDDDQPEKPVRKVRR